MIKRYFYGNSIKGFLDDSKEQIIGQLSMMHTSTFTLLGTQTNAWMKEIELLKKVLKPRQAQLLSKTKFLKNLLVEFDTFCFHQVQHTHIFHQS